MHILEELGNGRGFGEYRELEIRYEVVKNEKRSSAMR